MAGVTGYTGEVDITDNASDITATAITAIADATNKTPVITKTPNIKGNAADVVTALGTVSYTHLTLPTKA